MPAKEPTWTPERVELLKIRFAAGLSCREIANDLGVSRNAVIGKISRLDLTRENEPRRTARKDDAKRRRTRSVPRLQYQLLRKLYDEAEPAADPGTISSEHPCSLLELSEHKCRWPISTPGTDDFCFCGNRPLDGLPYCVGHTRLAYRPRQRVAQR
jgi:GcrA cell cycle regulator